MWLVGLAIWAVPTQAHAQSCRAALNANRATLCRNNFTIDLYQGPVFAPLRVIGLGGAYAAISEGVDGLGQNAAAPSVRSAFSTNWIDFELSLGASLLGALKGADIDNSGDAGSDVNNFFYVLGGMVQIGRFGIAFLGDFQNYQTATDPKADITIARGHLNGAYGFMDGQLNIGVGLRQVAVLVNASNPDTGKNENTLQMAGFSPEIGVLIRPDYAPYRIGVTYRHSVQAGSLSDSQAVSDPNGVSLAGGFPVPSIVRWPWELELGVVLSAGPRPLNPKWVHPREHEQAVRAQIERDRQARRQEQEQKLARVRDEDERAARAAELVQLELEERKREDEILDNLRKKLAIQRDSRYKNWPREHIMVTAELLVTGATNGGVGLYSFLRREDVASGNNISLQPRLGMEGEPVPGYLITRVGTYLEPARRVVEKQTGIVAGARQHFTFGLDVRLFHWDHFGLFEQTWRLTLGGDLAPRYQNIGLSIGAWH
jgi:hypothetical protein